VFFFRIEVFFSPENRVEGSGDGQAIGERRKNEEEKRGREGGVWRDEGGRN
jgi:hypothetical protein